MNGDLFQRHWGPLVASLLLAVVAVIVLAALWRQSRWGQLGRTVRELRRCRHARDRARRHLRRAERRHARLDARRDRTPPRQLHAAQEQLQDARALLRIADDRMLVAANHVRLVIVEAFPPSRQDALRRRYLPDDATAARRPGA